MLRLSALALLLTAIGSPMAARAQPAEVFEPSDPDVSDADVIRWAASEVGRATPRPPRPPIPPDDYLGRSAPEGDVRVIDEPDVALRLLA